MKKGDPVVAIAADDVPARFNMGRVVTRTFEVFGKNFVSFCALALIVLIPQLLLQWFWGVNALKSTVEEQGVTGVQWTILEHYGVAILVSAILNYVLQAALVRGTVTTLNGDPARFADCLSTGVVSLPRVVGIGLLSTICCTLGAMLLIIPGIILATMLFVSVPASIVEKKPVLDSLSRSTELTMGHRWAIFGLMVVFILFCLAASLLIRPLAGLPALPIPHAPMTFDNFSVFALANTALEVVTTSIGAVGVASIYYELRTIKDGVEPEQLAAVFA